MNEEGKWFLLVRCLDVFDCFLDENRKACYYFFIILKE